MVALFAGLVVYLVVAVGVCATALILGDEDERRVALGLLVAAAATELASVLGGTHWEGANWGVAVVDVAFLAWLVVVTCRSRKFWPLWATAAQLAAVFAHVPAIVLPSFPKTLYAATQPFWVFPLLASLLVGSVVAARRPRDGRTRDRRLHDPDPSRHTA